MIPVQQPSFTIPAGGSFALQCDGRYFRIQSASGSLKVVGDSFGNMGAVAVGQGLQLRDSDPQFHRLTFIDTSGAANNVTVIIADANFVDATLLGTVNVVDGSTARTLTRAAFYGFAYVGAVAAQFAHGQIWNPPGSGKNVCVEQIYPFSSAGAANGFSLRTATVALPTLVGSAQNKLFGGPAGVAQLYNTNNAIPQGTQFGTVLRGAPLKFTEPLVLVPGTGLIVMGGTAGDDGGANIEFFEQSQ